MRLLKLHTPISFTQTHAIKAAWVVKGALLTAIIKKSYLSTKRALWPVSFMKILAYLEGKRK